ncbi:MAG: hypothetical protein JHD16_08105 [Solirubrobacteraceae bacterium]|nr:hypothetical protein [Solirubrobacteraceae bacterium]
MSFLRQSSLRDTLLIALAAAAVVTSSAHAATQKDSAPTDRKTGVLLKASLKYTDGSKGEVPAWSDIRVTVIRDGQQVVTDQLLPAGASVSYFQTPKLTAVDLDADDEPEVLVDVFTAERPTKRRTVVLHKQGNVYATEVSDWGTGGYRLANVTGNKAPEFLSADSRFPALFKSDSRGPLRVLEYSRGQVRDVSRNVRAELLRDAKRHRRALARARRTGDDPRAEVAAYAVDLVRLGRTAAAQAELRNAGRRRELGGSAKAFARKLDRSMVRWGYAKRRVLAGGV